MNGTEPTRALPTSSVRDTKVHVGDLGTCCVWMAENPLRWSLAISVAGEESIDGIEDGQAAPVLAGHAFGA